MPYVQGLTFDLIARSMLFLRNSNYGFRSVPFQNKLAFIDALARFGRTYGTGCEIVQETEAVGMPGSRLATRCYK